jgi:hypothetical protein
VPERREGNRDDAAPQLEDVEDDDRRADAREEPEQQVDGEAGEDHAIT